MWAVIAVCYTAVGLVAAGVTLAVFPPYGDYRPPLPWLVGAIVAYTLLWPFLAMIALGFLIGSILQSHHGVIQPLQSPPREPSRFMYRKLYEETPN